MSKRRKKQRSARAGPRRQSKQPVERAADGRAAAVGIRLVAPRRSLVLAAAGIALTLAVAWLITLVFETPTRAAEPLDRYTRQLAPLVVPTRGPLVPTRDPARGPSGRPADTSTPTVLIGRD